MPTIEVVDPEDWAAFDEALGAVDRYDAVLIGSKNAVAAVKKRGFSISVPVVAVGRKTKAAAERIASDVWLPEEANAEGMVRLIGERLSPAGKRFLFLRAPEGRETAVDMLVSAGAVVDAVVAYRIVQASPSAEVVASLGGADVFTFMSGETLAAFLAVVPDGSAMLRQKRVAVIGPVARERAAALGVRVDVTPTETSAEAMVAAVVGS